MIRKFALITMIAVALSFAFSCDDSADKSGLFSGYTTDTTKGTLFSRLVGDDSQDNIESSYASSGTGYAGPVGVEALKISYFFDVDGGGFKTINVMADRSAHGAVVERDGDLMLGDTTLTEMQWQTLESLLGAIDLDDWTSGVFWGAPDGTRPPENTQVNDLVYYDSAAGELYFYSWQTETALITYVEDIAAFLKGVLDDMDFTEAPPMPPMPEPPLLDFFAANDSGNLTRIVSVNSSGEYYVHGNDVQNFFEGDGELDATQLAALHALIDAVTWPNPDPTTGLWRPDAPGTGGFYSINVFDEGDFDMALWFDGDNVSAELVALKDYLVTLWDSTDKDVIAVPEPPLPEPQQMMLNYFTMNDNGTESIDLSVAGDGHVNAFKYEGYTAYDAVDTLTGAELDALEALIAAVDWSTSSSMPGMTYPVTDRTATITYLDHSTGNFYTLFVDDSPGAEITALIDFLQDIIDGLTWTQAGSTGPPIPVTNDLMLAYFTTDDNRTECIDFGINENGEITAFKYSGYDMFNAADTLTTAELDTLNNLIAAVDWTGGAGPIYSDTTLTWFDPVSGMYFNLGVSDSPSAAVTALVTFIEDVVADLTWVQMSGTYTPPNPGGPTPPDGPPPPGTP